MRITESTFPAARSPDGYTGSDSTLNGGKISLTSTGDTGKITLGAGVDYNGNATDGTLAAASTAAGAVVVDAQGSKGVLGEQYHRYFCHHHRHRRHLAGLCQFTK